MKKIALFSDGTGNSSSSSQKTNVWRAYHALDISPGSNQIAFYDNGVGTSAFSVTAVLGLAFGWGLARNVRQIYGFLCRTYVPGDEIYGFGFSRGAFTMRVVIGLIANQGIVDRNRAKDERDLDRLIAAAYNRLRREAFTPSLLSFFLRPLRDLWLNTYHRILGRSRYQPEKNIRYRDEEGDEPLIRFVGVWDTVDAYGLPIDELTRAWDKVVWPLTANDRSPSSRIGRACHALAIDEQRESFEPMLWNEKGVDEDRLMQVWFPGVHSNVGGGYPDDGLAFIALDWMLTESEKKDGLKYLSQERGRYQANCNGPVYNSRGGAGFLYRYAPRKIESLCKQKRPGLANWLKRKLKWLRPEYIEVNENEVDIAKPKIHHSALDRIKYSGDGYAPINLPADYAVVECNGDVIDIANPGDKKHRLSENHEQAKTRREYQSSIWTKVWSRKILYLMTLAVLVLFVAHPYRDKEPIKFVEPFVGTISEPIRTIPGLVGKIPGLGFAESWATKYAAYPFEFIIGLMAIGGLIFSSSKVRAGLRDEMRTSWDHVIPKDAARGGGRRQQDFWKLRQLWGQFIDSSAWQNKVATPVRIVTEAVAVFAFLFLVAAAVSRMYYVAADGFGAFCHETDVRGQTFGKEFDFNPKNTCADTGLRLERGEKYVINLTVNDWYDDTIPADVNGWRPGEAPWYMSLFTPMRRHLFVDWYQPVARIDNKLFDRYPLRPATDDSPANQLCMEIEARRSGRLFLYLNDAVIFAPGLFYENNEGTAKVTVTKADGGCPAGALRNTS